MPRQARTARRRAHPDEPVLSCGSAAGAGARLGSRAMDEVVLFWVYMAVMTAALVCFVRAYRTAFGHPPPQALGPGRLPAWPWRGSWSS